MENGLNRLAERKSVDDAHKKRVHFFLSMESCADVPELPASIWELIALMGGIQEYRAVVYAIPSLIRSKGVSRRAQQHFTTCTVCYDGRKEWRLNGIRHRVDGPAVVHLDGREERWIGGTLTSANGPAYTHPSGVEFWYYGGLRHRTDGPAATFPSGYEEWRLYDRLHRVGGPAVTHADGSEEWWVDGKRIEPPHRAQKRRRRA